MGRKIFGLDIRSDAVSAVLVDNSIKGIVIESHIHVPLEMTEGDNNGNLSEALEMIASEINITDAVSVVSIPADQISYRNIQVPFREPKKIRQVLPFELEPLLPFSVDDLVIDFNTLTFPENSVDTGILAATVERGKLASYKEDLAAYHIDPQSVAVGGYQTILCLSQLSEIPEQSLFIDIDIGRSTLFAVISGHVHLVRSFIMRSSPSMAPAQLCTKIQQTISASEDILGADYEPDVIYVTGKGLKENNYEEQMAGIFELPVKRINLVQDADANMLEQPDHSWAPELMDNAFALALSEIVGIEGLNLSRRQFAAKKYWMAHKTNIIKSGVLLGVVLILALMNVVFSYHSMQRQADDLDKQIQGIFKSAFPEAKIVDPLRQMQAMIKEAKGQSTGPEEADNTVRAIDVLNDISKFIPQQSDVTLSRFIIGPDNVQISGDTDTFNTVDDIKTKLEQGKLFKKITTITSTKDNSENRINFKLKIDL